MLSAMAVDSLAGSTSERAVQQGVPDMVLPVNALGVDLQQHFYAMTRPLSHLGRRNTRVQT
jgi:hypothetical protein